LTALNDFFNYGETQGLFHVQLISSFPNAVAEGYNNVYVNAINFDNTTRIYCTNKGLLQNNGHPTLRSCDALKFLFKSNPQGLDFIEFKVLTNQTDLQTWISANLHLTEKITDSLVVLEGILADSNLSANDKRSLLNSIILKFIVAVGGRIVDDEGRYTLSVQMKLLEVDAIITNLFENITFNYASFEYPVIKKISELYSYYYDINEV